MSSVTRNSRGASPRALIASALAGGLRSRNISKLFPVSCQISIGCGIRETELYEPKSILFRPTAEPGRMTGRELVFQTALFNKELSWVNA